MGRAWGSLAAVFILACDDAPSEPADPEVPSAEVAGCVSLPAGVEAAWLTSGLQEVAVVDGCFVVDGSADGAQLAIATSAAGDPLAMAWLGVDAPTIDSRTTAEVLIFHAVGGFTVPPEQLEPLRQVIAKVPEVDVVAAAVEGQLAADPAAFAAPNPALAAALQGAVDTLLPSPSAQRGAAGPAYAVLVNPGGERSGITVTTLSGVNQIAFQNRFRRPAIGFVDRVSTFDDEGVETASPKVIKAMPIGAIQALAGGVGTFAQILAGTQTPGGLAESQDVAYVPRTTEPLDVPNVEGAKKTRYRVAIVGPGALPGDLTQLTPDEVSAQEDLTRTFVVKDLLLPMILQWLVPSKGTAESLGHDFGTDVVQDLIRVLTTGAPQIWDLAAAGDVTGALRAALDLILGSGTFRDQVLALVYDAVYDLRDEAGRAASQRAAAHAAKFIAVSGAVDSLLTSFDVTVVGQSIGASTMADVHQLDVIDPLVRLDPEASVIGFVDQVTLEANVVDAGEDVVFEYRFHASGGLGDLSNGIHTGVDITSSTPWVSFRSQSTEGTATVSVEVYQVVLSQRVRLGEAEATVEVQESPCDPTPLAGIQYVAFTISEPSTSDPLDESRSAYWGYVFTAPVAAMAFDIDVTSGVAGYTPFRTGPRRVPRYGVPGAISTDPAFCFLAADSPWPEFQGGPSVDPAFEDVAWVMTSMGQVIRWDVPGDEPAWATNFGVYDRAAAAATVTVTPVCP